MDRCDHRHSLALPFSRTIIPAMARRSLGVVLIVTLLGWTVNQPTSGCQSAHSRAAVVVLAGASPAHQPEPSPSRHNCCPHESEPAKEPASAMHCSSRISLIHQCCTVSSDIGRDLPPGIAKHSLLAKFALISFSLFELRTRAGFVGPLSGLSQRTSLTVLRL